MPRVTDSSRGRDASKRRETRAKRAPNSTISLNTDVSRRLRKRKIRSSMNTTRKDAPFIPEIGTLTRLPLATSRDTERLPHDGDEDRGEMIVASSESLPGRPIFVGSRSRTPSDASIIDLTNDSSVEDEGVVELPTFQMPAVGSSVPVSSRGDTVHPVVGDGPVGGATSDDVIVIRESDDDVLFVGASCPQSLPSKSMPLTLPSTPSNSVSHPSSSAAKSPAASPSATSITCPVCMDRASQFERLGRKLVTTTCGHVFCEVCIRNAISSLHKCPVCNKKLTLRQYHRLFIT